MVVLLAAGAAIYASSTYWPSTTSSPVPPIQQSSLLSAFNPATDLEFGMLPNSSNVNQGQTLAVSLNLYNTLGTVNNVTGEEDWQLTNQSENSGVVGWNCAQNDIFRIEVVSGYYGLSNFSKGTPLDVFVWTQSAFNQCLSYVRAANDTAEPLSSLSQGQDNYAFSPKSNVAWWTNIQDWSVRCGPANTTISYPCPRVGQEAVMNETMILKTSLFATSTGVFTVICGDEWGDLGITHFNVAASSQGTTRTTSVTCVQTLSAPLYLVVKDDNGTPIPNQPLSIQAHLLEGFSYNSRTDSCDSILSTHVWTNETGSDGKIELGVTGDVFNITTSYLGKTYYVNAHAEGAESAECVTLSLPSGAVSTTYAGQFQYQC